MALAPEQPHRSCEREQDDHPLEGCLRHAAGILSATDNASDPGYLICTFRRSDVANAAASIVCQYGSDLGSNCTPAVHDGTKSIITVTNDFYGASQGVDKVEVKIKCTLAPTGKILLGAMRVVTAP